MAVVGERALLGGPHRDAGCRVIDGKRGRGLEKAHYDAAGLEPVFPYQIGIGKGFFYVSEVPMVFYGHVVRPVIVNDRRALEQRLLRVIDGRHSS